MTVIAASPATSAVRSDRRAALAVVFALLGLYLLTMGGHSYSVDDETYLAGTRALVHGSATLHPGPDIANLVGTVANKNGGRTTAAPIGTLALFSPFYAAGRAISFAFPSAWREEALRTVYFSANGFLTAFTAGLLVLLCIALGASRRSAVLLAIAYGAGSYIWPHAKTGFSEPGTALLLTAAMLASVHWWRGPTTRRAYLVGFLSGCVVLTRLSTVFFVPVFWLAGVAPLLRPLAVRPLVRQSLAFVAGGLIPVLAFCANAWVRFGGFFRSGYPAVKFTTPIYEGVYGMFLSAGKGVFWYAPVTLLALFGLRNTLNLQRRFLLTVTAILVVHLAVYARFEIWSGDNAYGPRYLVPLVPLIVALAAPVVDRALHWQRALVVSLAVGVLVPGLLGASMYFNGVGWNAREEVAALQIPDPTVSESFLPTDFIPRASPLVLHAESSSDLVSNTLDRISGEPGGITPLPPTFGERIYWYARAVEPDFWWAWWSAKGGPSAMYALLVVPLGCLAVAWRLARGRKLVVPAHRHGAVETATT